MKTGGYREREVSVVVHVGVRIENEIFARGIEACLRDETDTWLWDADERPDGPDVVITSPAQMGVDWGCPVLVCSDEPVHPTAVPPAVMGVVPMQTLTPAQLVPAVRAGAAGLRLATRTERGERIDGRGLEVLRLLAEGAGTREISSELGYSERTIKSVIADVLHRLEARSKAHAVALALRQSLI